MSPKKHSDDRYLNTGSDKTYKALKIGICQKSESQEVKVLNYLKETKSSHEGRYCVRRACNSFEIQVPGGRHHCIVYEPLGMSLLDFVARQQDYTLNTAVAKWTVTYLLKAVDYLHTSGVVHTGIRLISYEVLAFTDDPFVDIKLDNIQNTLPDEETAILKSFVTAERTEPSPRKFIDEARTIYTSRPLEYGNIMTFPILSDLGMCMFGQEEYKDIIQAVPYRAPEVILRTKWNCSVDIWNLGVLVSGCFLLVHPTVGSYNFATDLPQVWELLFAEHLFGSDNEEDGFAMMITYLGPPPSELLERSQIRGHYFDDHGEYFLVPDEKWI
jgi:serine/threonine-protein kinase SRPK3